MPIRSGRLERRIRLAIPVQITSLQNPGETERTTTENISSLGIRVLTQQARTLDEQVFISTPAGDLRAYARVVYCQRLPEGHFGVGFEFHGTGTNWPKGEWTATAD